MIIAAGVGSRLGELGRTTPKVLIEVGGRPLLVRHLELLRDAGARRVVINTHHHAERVEAAARAHDLPLEVVCVREPRLLGTAGGVRNALDRLGAGPFLILYGDVLVAEPLLRLPELHRQTGALATLAVHEAEETEGKGVVEVDGRGRVVGFTEKGPRSQGRKLINSGVYVLEREVVAELEPGAVCDFGHDVFPTLLRRGLPIAAYRLREPVIDIGTPEGLLAAREMAAR
jgi:NDP-sugar pyrophosphorylase family protein